MFNKLYETIKSIFKNNYKFFLGLIITFFVLTFQLPYYIDAPGGLIDISKRIEVENANNLSGSFNLAYVSEFKATIPTLLWSLIDKDWDVLKKSDVVLPNETEELSDFRNHLLLEEANQSAIITAFNLANKFVKVTNRKVYVVFVDENAKTDLKIGDEIIKINGKNITSREDVIKLIKDYKENDTIKFTVKKDNMELEKEGILYNYEGRNIIGLTLSELKEIDTNENVTFKFEPSESGPSGGFMMALSIYNYLVPKDISKGLKIVGTGTIDEEGNIGAIGGIEYKIKGAIKEKADLFFVPSGENYEDAKKLIEEEKLDLKIIEVKHIEDAIKYLNTLN